MEKYDIYKDISLRTDGDIYIGVVGPVRTGKSTFITKFMESFVIPNISNKFKRQIATDEMPQSADGKTIMTTQPKFVPADSVKVQFKNKVSANVRLVDCVGYLVEGAFGHEEEDKPRLVKTPWSDKEIPFEKAAEIGTKKVITDYSTLGILITTDGSIGSIERKNYEEAEDRVVNELKSCNKPFIIVINSKDPDSDNCQALAQSLSVKYDVGVLTCNVLNLTADDIAKIMENILLEFPMQSIDVNIPKWIQTLPSESEIVCEIIEEIKEKSSSVSKMKDYYNINNAFSGSEDFETIEIKELNLSKGVASFNVVAKDGLFYRVLSKECCEEIQDDCQLISYIKSFSGEKRKFDKIKNALLDAEENGYGVVIPSQDEMNLSQPILVKQGGKYGVKLKANAPSYHIMKINVESEVSPIVGNEKQGEDMVNYIMEKFEENPEGIWETNMFGKSLFDMMNDGLSAKMTGMPIEAKNKMRRTISRIVNEGRGGVICILL